MGKKREKERKKEKKERKNREQMREKTRQKDKEKKKEKKKTEKRGAKRQKKEREKENKMALENNTQKSASASAPTCGFLSSLRHEHATHMNSLSSSSSSVGTKPQQPP